MIFVKPYKVRLETRMKAGYGKIEDGMLEQQGKKAKVSTVIEIFWHIFDFVLKYRHGTTYFAMNPWWERKDIDSGIDRLNTCDSCLSAESKSKWLSAPAHGRQRWLAIHQETDHRGRSKDILYLASTTLPVRDSLVEHLKNIRRSTCMIGTEAFLFSMSSGSVNWERNLNRSTTWRDWRSLQQAPVGFDRPERSRLTGRQIITTLTSFFHEFLSFHSESPVWRGLQVQSFKRLSGKGGT